MTRPDDRLLRTSLRANAAFSTLCGLTSLSAAAPLAAALGVPEPAILTSLGAQLLGFAALLVWLASRPTIRAGLALAVVVADALWVVGTVPLLMAGVLGPAGNWTAFAIANVVGLFGVLQYVGIRRMRGGSVAATA
jgi:hypothetical protein